MWGTLINDASKLCRALTKLVNIVIVQLEEED